MKPSIKEYKKGLSKKESFFISSLTREERLKFKIEDPKKHHHENTKEFKHSQGRMNSVSDFLINSN